MDLLFRGRKLKYEEYNGLSVSNTPVYKSSRLVDGYRIKGQTKITKTVTDGSVSESTTCNIVYRVKEYIKTNSKIEGHTVMECVPVDTFIEQEEYLVYVK